MIASLIGIICIAVIVSEIRKKKRGQGSCSCGGQCGACGMDCHRDDPPSPKK
ncbi:MAG: FeoB-associated Cys-rich membrane protein [Clostridia bacterium]|nr:FeoB-associated Cys-rich membrane protein [Clostridia bacterium]